MTHEDDDSPVARRRDVRQLPWLQRPRRNVGQLDARVVAFPFLFAPLQVAKLAIQWRNGAAPGPLDWLFLLLFLLPWAYGAMWLRRPTVGSRMWRRMRDLRSKG